MTIQKVKGKFIMVDKENVIKELYVIHEKFFKIIFENPDKMIDFIKNDFDYRNNHENVTSISKIGYRVIKDDHIIKEIYTNIDYRCPIRKFIIELYGVINAYENDK